MQIYSIKCYNFLRFGEKDNTLVFDLTQEEKAKLKNGEITMDSIYKRVMSNPIEHIKNVKQRGIEKLIGITGIVGGDGDRSNGAGKSSTLDAISYAHYEKIVRRTANTDKIEKAGLSVVTKIDGKYPEDLQESYVEELFEENERIYRIKRGRIFTKAQRSSSPLLEFECINKDEIDKQSGHRTSDTKEAISDVITMSYDTFVNSIMFGQNDSGKFLMGTDKIKKEMLISLLELENVVSGCLELIRDKKNTQDKKVQSINTNIELLENVFCEAYSRFINKPIEPFNKQFIDNVISNIGKSLVMAQETVILNEKELSNIDSRLTGLLASDKLIKIEKIKEDGRKINKEKKDKEQDMLSKIKEWENLKKDCDSKKEERNNKINLVKRDIITKRSKIKEVESNIVSFESKIKEYSKIAVSVEQSKKDKPIVEKKIEELKEERERLIKETSSTETLISICNNNIRKFNEQLKNIDSSGKLLCSECQSIVNLEHINKKILENTIEKEDKLKKKEKYDKDIKDKDVGIRGLSEKLREFSELLAKESNFLSSQKDLENEKKRLLDINGVIEEYNKMEKDIALELLKLDNRTKEYNEKIEGIKSSYNTIISDLKDKVNELIKQFKEAEDQAKDVNNQINDLNKEKDKLTETKRTNIEKIGFITKEKNVFEQHKKDLEEKKRIFDSESMVLNRYLLLEEIYGLDGIQTRIVQKYLPLLNVYIKEFLDILADGEIFIKFIINDRSKVDMIISGGTADSYDMLSGGEKTIIRLACSIGLSLLSFTRTAQKPELILLDEILGSLDNARIENVFKMIKKLQDKFSRVMLITHQTEIKEMIESNIVIEKDFGKNGLSKIKLIT